MTATVDDAVADLQRANAELQRQLDESRAELAVRNSEYGERIEHQAAANDVLKVMSASPGDPQPVFDLIVARAKALCNGSGMSLFEYDGALVYHRAITPDEAPEEVVAAYNALFPMVPTRGSITCRAILDRKIIHVRDIASEAVLPAVKDFGYKSQLTIPLLRDGTAIGAITLTGNDTGGFSDSQVELLKTFAEQAVIAIASATTYRELQQRTADLQGSLEYQTATSDVLKVISRSAFDLQPVLDAVCETAARLCGTETGMIFRREGELYHLVANIGFPAEFEAFLKSRGWPASRGTVTQQTALEGRVVHVVDVTADPEYTMDETSTLGKTRTVLGVPLLRDGEPVGVITLGRERVEPFTERQIELVRTFADQAVIAIENTRLLTEQREALEQQTATAEILQVINSSPGDLAPVFDAMLERATRLCEAAFGGLQTYDGEYFRSEAHRTNSQYLDVGRPRGPWRPEPGSTGEALVNGESIVHVHDLATDEKYRASGPVRRNIVEIAGARTFLSLALRKDDALVGALHLFRQQVRPFSEKEIKLLQNFAAQAVIAMENARLITETREALEQQTATAEVLQVINSSPGDLAPVFDAMLEKAMRLCQAPFGYLLRQYDGNYSLAAARGVPAAMEEYFAHMDQPRRGEANTRLLEGEPYIHILDLKDDEAYRAGALLRRATVDLGGFRTGLAVPLRKDGELLGTFNLGRDEVRPFSEKQIALVQNFAAQAVIAIENARLITETREALAQQTATAEVLGVINSSPGDLAPVFEAMLERAMRLCGAAFGMMHTFDGTALHLVAHRGIPPAFAEFAANPANQPGPGGATPRLIRDPTLRFMHVLDLKAEEAYRSGDPMRRALVDVGNARTLLAVPLRKNRAMVGVINIYRQEVRAYSDKQIALLQNFAAQAVIAMENARLITETREALDQQRASAEILSVISTSVADAQPVFDKILDSCKHIFGGDELDVLLVDDDGLLQVAAYVGKARDAVLATFPAPVDITPAGRAIRERRVAHYPDVLNRPDTPRVLRRMGEIVGYHSVAFAPMVWENRGIGAIGVARSRGAFTDRELTILQSFADQAVIAINNARLFDAVQTRTRDLEEALGQQTATAEVLQVINASPGDLAPVFDAMLEKAMRLCGAAFGELHTYDGERFHTAALRGVPAAYAEVRSKASLSARPGSGSGRILETKRPVHIPDLMAENVYEAGLASRRAAVDLGGARTALAVPLLKDEAVLGLVMIYRQEVRPFSDKQIALLQNFAAQAVIAIENARLLGELRDRQAELRVTFDNMADGVVMFDEALRLAAWNRNFQELLDLPDAFLSERHGFDDYIRYLAERGEFGDTDAATQIGRLRARIGEHYSFERTRPDGSIIEVRHNPMPGGGIVLIYSDITERKRSEAEIQAARDAAEAAYRDLKAAQASLIQAEKMASLGQLTAGIAHEIKNPLNFVNNFANLSVELLDELKEATAPAVAALGEAKRAEIDETIELLTGNLEKIAAHGRRADNIVKSMLEHSRGVTGERRQVDLNGLVEEALNLAYHGARAQDQSFNITLERDYASALKPIELAPQEITRVFLNLFGNGFYAANKRSRENGGGSFRPTLAVATHDDGDAVEVKVRDNGTGIPPEIRDKLFQPFFTTKPTGEGTGLGLSISYDIVTQQHGGTITVASEPGAFTEFTVRLPRH